MIEDRNFAPPSLMLTVLHNLGKDHTAFADSLKEIEYKAAPGRILMLDGEKVPFEMWELTEEQIRYNRGTVAPPVVSLKVVRGLRMEFNSQK